MAETLAPAAGWLVVGTGRHVDRFGLPALGRARGARAVSLCGTDPVRTADLAARHGVNRWGSSIEGLLDDPEVTHVYVASRNDDHVRHVLAAAHAGKHVLCEKPLAADATTAQRMVDACDKAAVALGTGFHLRHNAANRQAKHLIEVGAIGRLLWIDITYLHVLSHDDGPARLATSRDTSTPSRGAMAGTGAHAIDLAHWFASDRLGRPAATAVGLDTTPAGPQRVVHVSGTTDNGILVTLAAGRASHPANGVVITGEAGRITITGSVGNAGGGVLTLETAESTGSQVFASGDVYAAQFEHFAAATAEGRQPDASGADGVTALQVVDAVERAIADPIHFEVADVRLTEGAL